MRKTAIILIILLLMSTGVYADEIISFEKPKMEYEDKTIVNTFALVTVSEGEVSSFAKEKCEKARELGLLDEKIVPDYQETITKAQFCALAVNLYEKLSGEVLEEAKENPFADTKNPDVLKLVSVGAVKGETYNTFCPDERITTSCGEEIILNVVRKAKSIPFEVSDSKKFMSFEKAVIKIYDVFDYAINYEKSVAQRLEDLTQIYKDGSYWNKKGDFCNHEKDGYEFCNYYEGNAGSGIQCHGFALMISDTLFGCDAPVKIYTDLNEIKIGDIIRYNDRHTMIVTKIDTEYIEVLEANYNHDCKIKWNRKVEREFLENCELLCITRY